MRQLTQGFLGAFLFFGASLVYAQADQGADVDANDGIELAQAAGGDALATYDAVLRQISGLVIYNELRQTQIDNQLQEVEDIRASLQQVPDIEQQIPPLLVRMVEGLEDFIALDLPFLPEERANGLAELQLVMESADVSDADKMRRVLDAWAIENEYGRSVAAYQTQLDVDGSGNMRAVDLLRIGRIALIYQTTDEDAITGAWDPARNDWVALGNEHRNSVRQAVRMARSQIAPEIALVPIPPPAE